ncbi:MAG: ECF transporter S component [Clostridia bacterium]|nr:ECF transporter S component [Clostridia bacterium]
MHTSPSTQKIRLIVFNALFIALIFAMQLFGIGMIRLGVINITFYCSVIAVGTLLLGLKSGLIQAFAFGSISLYTAITEPSALVAPILAQSVPLLALMCYLPRMLVPVAAHLTYRLTRASSKNERLGLTAGGSAASLTNSILFLGIMILAYLPMLADHPGVLAAIGGVVLYGSIPEFIVAGIITPPLVLALRKVRH